ncbi:helix-turn-helix domain-containing protein [Subtercola sp. PAMC28395]|uniref:helix-turn-helix domain-containing protein n=1 Tax=Subtercola sp. PAMC28395 TaxID=2846775 RepID=UPI001C0BB1E7|nr:helix-turn-helix domain-containing protein [Subtercola sp. PAMC28395]QWT24951.1 helix-turn-helix domain-containing protein [Subtercola sp. PAMC28395]
MTRGRPVSPELRARIISLIEAGMTRNAVAREVGIAPSAVTRIAQDEELTFDRSMSAAAVAAAQSDAKAKRAELQLMLVAKAEDFIVSIDQPFLAFSFGGKDNTYEEHELDGPPTGDILNLMRSTSLALKEARDLRKDDDDEGVGEAESLLMNLILELGLSDDD